MMQCHKVREASLIACILPFLAIYSRKVFSIKIFETQLGTFQSESSLYNRQVHIPKTNVDTVVRELAKSHSVIAWALHVYSNGWQVR